MPWFFDVSASDLFSTIPFFALIIICIIVVLIFNR